MSMLKNVRAELWISADRKRKLKMSVRKRRATSVSAFKNLDSYKEF